jgi:hypothetical protein
MLQTTGCMTWKTPTTSPGDVGSQSKLRQVRVTRSDSSRVVLLRPRIVGDSLTGQRQGYPDSEDGGGRLAVSLNDVQSVAVLRQDGTRTTLLIVGLGLGFAGAVALHGEDESFLVPDALLGSMNR